MGDRELGALAIAQFDLGEFRKCLKETKHYATDEEAEAILRNLDMNGDGHLSFEQFVMSEIHFRAQVMPFSYSPCLDRASRAPGSQGHLHPCCTQVDGSRMLDAFHLLDRDGNGEVTLAELHEVGDARL